MNQANKEQQNLLRRALTGNAVFSILSGAAILLAGRSLVKFLGLPDKVSLAIVGISLIMYSVILLLFARKPKIKVSNAWIAVMLDGLWVAGSCVLLLVVSFSVAGKWTVALVAELVLAFAVLQWLGIRQTRKKDHHA